MRRTAATVALAGLFACGGPDPEVPAVQPAIPSPTPVVLAPPQAPPVAVEGRYAASHILIAYTGATGAVPDLVRSQAQALALAQSLHEQIAAGQDLAALAVEHSSDSSGPRGGSIGVYEAGTMMPAFEQAVASVQPGQLAPLVHTPYGVHVVRRDAVTEGRFAHIVVGFDGAWRTQSTRSRAQARALIDATLARLEAGEPWSEVAASVTEDGLASVGGDLGVVSPGQMIPDFESAAFALQVGERSGVVETPYGLHIIRRSALPE